MTNLYSACIIQSPTNQRLFLVYLARSGAWAKLILLNRRDYKKSEGLANIFFSETILNWSLLPTCRKKKETENKL